jgi:hypothetical protein
MTYRNNNQNIEVEEKEIDTYPNNFKRSYKGYEYLELDQDHDLLRLRVTFFIRRERLEIVEKIINLKHNGFFQSFIEEAIMNLVELDLNSPESIAEDFCKNLLKRWMDPAADSKQKRKSLQNPVSE